MKKKLPVFIFTLLAFILTVSFFSFAAEIQDDNIYCYVTRFIYRTSDRVEHTITSDNITQYNGIWHFPHSNPEDMFDITSVSFYFKVLNVDYIYNMSFDFNLLSFESRSPNNDFNNMYFDLLDSTDSYATTPIFQYNKVVLPTYHYSNNNLNKVADDCILSFRTNYSHMAIGSLSFSFDNFIINDRDVIIINQNDEIISKLTDQNEKLDHLNESVDTVVDVLEDDSANVDMGTESFINKIDDLNADVGSFMSGHNFNINSVPANTLSEVGKIGSLASSVISCINLTNNPYLQSTGRTNYVKSELGWYWPILVFTSAFCLVACLLARKGRALSPDAAEHHIESESSDESTYTREKWNPRTKTWSNIGTYRTRSTSNHSSRSSRK